MTTPAAPPSASSSGLKGLVLAGDGPPRARGNMPEAVAYTLREAILDGSLKPGAWLREAEVARELNVSRTPVRDALRILAAEHLVDIHANQGAVVTQTTSDDIIEVYVVREPLEALAFRLAARQSSRELRDTFAAMIPEMKRAAEEQRIPELSRLFMQFHRVVRESVDNRYLKQALTRIQNAARRFPDPTLHMPGRIEESLQEHIALAEAVVRGDAAQAEELAAKHIRHLAELRIQRLLHQ